MKAQMIGIGIIAGAVGISLGVSSAYAVSSSDASLYTCQRTAGIQMRKLVEKKIKAIGACVDRVAKESVLRGAADAERAAKFCRSKMRRITNTASPARTLFGKFEKKVAKACDPAVNDNLPHTADDVLGLGNPQTPSPLNVNQLSAMCAQFGGDDSIDSIDEWIGCMDAAATCQANQAVATQFPRALEWLDLVIPSVEALGDHQKIVDAVEVLTATNAAIEGPTNDNLPEIVCGVE